MAIFTNLSPAAGPLGATQDEARWQAISVDIIVAGAEVPLILAEFGSDPYEILTVYDGADFPPLFKDHSTVTESPAGTFSFYLLPVGGWMDSQVDLQFLGTTSLPAIPLLMPDPPSLEVPALSDFAKLLGRDILFRDGDFMVGPHGDYQTTEGRENLRLAIVRRIQTAQNEYRLNQKYGAGLGNFAKEAMDQGTIDNLRVVILDQLLQDRRISAVRSLTVKGSDRDPGILRVKVTVQHIEEDRPESFDLTIPEVGG
jgi:hypothetical protein